METEFYTCEFCQTNFKPKRRKIQRFCSNTCRSKNHHHKNNLKKESLPTLNPYKRLTKKEEVIPSLEAEVIIAEPQKKQKIEKVSGAGIANAVIGNLAAQALIEGAKYALGSKKNQPATNELKNPFTQRYFKIYNMEPRFDGALPHFDMQTSKIVYIPDQNFKNFANSVI